MDPLDSILETAFLRFIDQFRRDRPLLIRRLRRRRLVTVARPLRAWCLCLRASDTRIRSGHTAHFDEEAAAEGNPHTVQFPGWGVRKLIAPVQIPWPGLRQRDAAAKLGMDDSSLNAWVRKGVFHLDHDYCRPHGYRGPRCPI